MLAIGSLQFKHFDLAGGGVNWFHRFADADADERRRSAALDVRFDLNAKGDALLSAMLLRRELGGDAVDFDVNADLFQRIPDHFDDIQRAQDVRLRHMAQSIR